MGLRLYRDRELYRCRCMAGLFMDEHHIITLLQYDIFIFIGFKRLLIEANLLCIAINDKFS